MSVRALVLHADTFYAAQEDLGQIETFLIEPDTISRLPTAAQIRLASINPAARSTIVGAAPPDDVEGASASLLGAALAAAPTRAAALATLRVATQQEKRAAAESSPLVSNGLNLLEADISQRESTWVKWLVGPDSPATEIVTALARDSALRRALADRLAPPSPLDNTTWLVKAGAGAMEIGQLALRLVEGPAGGSAPAVQATHFLAKLLDRQADAAGSIVEDFDQRTIISSNVAQELASALDRLPLEGPEQAEAQHTARRLVQEQEDDLDMVSRAGNVLQAARLLGGEEMPARVSAVASRAVAELEANVTRWRELAQLGLTLAAAYESLPSTVVQEVFKSNTRASPPDRQPTRADVAQALRDAYSLIQLLVNLIDGQIEHHLRGVISTAD